MKICKNIARTGLFVFILINSACDRGTFEIELQQQDGDGRRHLPYVTPKSVDLDPIDSLDAQLILPGRLTSQAVAGFFQMGNTGKKRYFLLDKNSPKDRYHNRFIFDENGDDDLTNDADYPLSRGKFIALRNRHYVEFDSVLLTYDFQAKKERTREYIRGRLYFWQPVRGLPTTAHFLRNSWRQGNFEFDDQNLSVIVIDDDCNGFFDARDSWAIFQSENADFAEVHFNHFRDMTQLAWFGENAFEILKIDGSGHGIFLKRRVPEFSKEEDLSRDNPYLEEPQRPRAAREIQWLSSLKKAKQRARRARKPVLIKFNARWSGPCITMDERTYRDAEIVSLSDRFICLRLDGDSERRLAKIYDITRYPTTVILDYRGREISRAIGYQPAAEFSAYLAQFVK